MVEILIKRYIGCVGNAVCKSREEGGLGVKSVEIMNATLISKWKWRILTEKDVVWCGVLKSSYGNMRLKVLVGDISVVGRNDSIWWRDVLILDNYKRLLDKHFAGALNCSVGNREKTPFWYACWLDVQPIMEAYPELY